MAKLSIDEIIEAIGELTILELNELVTKVEEKFDVSASAGVVVQAGGAAAGGDAAEEKTEFTVELTSFDAGEKVKVIKAIRELLGVGLKEAKELVEGAPAVVKEEVGKDEAESIKAKLAEVGAVVTLK